MLSSGSESSSIAEILKALSSAQEKWKASCCPPLNMEKLEESHILFDQLQQLYAQLEEVDPTNSILVPYQTAKQNRMLHRSYSSKIEESKMKNTTISGLWSVEKDNDEKTEVQSTYVSSSSSGFTKVWPDPDGNSAGMKPT